MARELKYFYKTQDGKGWLGDYDRHDAEAEGLVEITKEAWDAHIAEINVVYEPTAAELHQQDIREQINAAKAYLASTDYIVIKIAESEDAEEIAAIREEYADVILERKAKRALINELEAELAE